MRSFFPDFRRSATTTHIIAAMVHTHQAHTHCGVHRGISITTLFSEWISVPKNRRAKVIWKYLGHGGGRVFLLIMGREEEEEAVCQLGHCSRLGLGDMTGKKSGPAVFKSEGSHLVAVMRRTSGAAETWVQHHFSKDGLS
eukprot:scaffold75773_cov57-Attheya_sp.AAC.4